MCTRAISPFSVMTWSSLSSAKQGNFLLLGEEEEEEEDGMDEEAVLLLMPLLLPLAVLELLLLPSWSPL